MHARTGGLPILANQTTDLNKRHGDHSLALRLKELRLIQHVYDAESRLLERSDFPDRDKVVVESCITMIRDADATDRGRLSAMKLMESVNRRLDAREDRISKNATERMKIKAEVASHAVHQWQPNGYHNPDPELQALIDGAGGISNQSKRPPNAEWQAAIDRGGVTDDEQAEPDDGTAGQGEESDVEDDRQ